MPKSNGMPWTEDLTTADFTVDGPMTARDEEGEDHHLEPEDGARTRVTSTIDSRIGRLDL